MQLQTYYADVTSKKIGNTAYALNHQISHLYCENRLFSTYWLGHVHDLIRLRSTNTKDAQE